ncbi:MAG: hypothetical protein ACD_58C00342G0002 [uncultured bacterium]|nr:MAG: hypothetical protein ACD_58C00342G0002 [uncultured bacterium]
MNEATLARYRLAEIVGKTVEEESGIFIKLSEYTKGEFEEYTIWKNGSPIQKVISDNEYFTFEELKNKTLAVLQTAPPQTTTHPQTPSPNFVQTSSSKTSQKSIVSILMLITACLVRAENISGIGLNRVWKGINEAQGSYLKYFFNGFMEMIDRIREIKAVASYFVEHINSFLAENGFTIQLRKDNSPGAFYVAAIIKIKETWLNKGKKVQMRAKDGQNYPAVKMKEEVTFYQLPSYQEPVASFEATNRDRICMIKSPCPEGQLDLTAWVIEAARQMRPTRTQYEGLIFPMVDLRQQENLYWLLGMHTTGQDGKPAIITQALAEVVLKMNESGCLAAAAVALGVSRGLDFSRGEPYQMNEPFLFWIDRPGIGPIFMAHISEADWKEPANLEM